jgi:hypothetical protein
VLGSSGMAAFMTSRIGAEMPPMSAPSRGGHAPTRTLALPEFLREPFSAAMSQSILLPAFIALFGVIAALFLVGFTGSAGGGLPGRTPEYRDPAGGDDYDDDDYVEYILRREPEMAEAEGDTEPLRARFPVSAPQREPIGFAHNGFHGDNGQRFRPVAEFSRPALQPTRHDDTIASPSARRQAGSHEAHARSSGYDSSARHQRAGDEPPRNKHHRADPEDPISGHHSS